VGLADLHLHTLASDGLIGPEALVDHVVAHTDLDVIAVTDHDETSAAVAARSHAVRSGYRIEVVPGVEVTTRDGHLLCLWVEERPPALWPLVRTAEWVRGQGGLCVAPHPFTRWTHSLNLAGAQHGAPALAAHRPLRPRHSPTLNKVERMPRTQQRTRSSGEPPWVSATLR
jgi:predicted metal-dependent phosphoesterase TrpH